MMDGTGICWASSNNSLLFGSSVLWSATFVPRCYLAVSGLEQVAHIQVDANILMAFKTGFPRKSTAPLSALEGSLELKKIKPCRQRHKKMKWLEVDA